MRTKVIFDRGLVTDSLTSVHAQFTNVHSRAHPWANERSHVRTYVQGMHTVLCSFSFTKSPYKNPVSG